MGNFANFINIFILTLLFHLSSACSPNLLSSCITSVYNGSGAIVQCQLSNGHNVNITGCGSGCISNVVNSCVTTNYNIASSQLTCTYSNGNTFVYNGCLNNILTNVSSNVICSPLSACVISVYNASNATVQCQLSNGNNVNIIGCESSCINSTLNNCVAINYNISSSQMTCTYSNGNTFLYNGCLSDLYGMSNVPPPPSKGAAISSPPPSSSNTAYPPPPPPAYSQYLPDQTYCANFLQYPNDTCIVPGNNGLIYNNYHIWTFSYYARYSSQVFGTYNAAPPVLQQITQCALKVADGINTNRCGFQFYCCQPYLDGGVGVQVSYASLLQWTQDNTSAWNGSTINILNAISSTNAHEATCGGGINATVLAYVWCA